MAPTARTPRPVGRLRASYRSQREAGLAPSRAPRLALSRGGWRRAKASSAWTDHHTPPEPRSAWPGHATGTASPHEVPLRGSSEGSCHKGSQARFLLCFSHHHLSTSAPEVESAATWPAASSRGRGVALDQSFLLGRLFHDLPPGGDPRDKGLALLPLQNCFPRWIMEIDRGKGLGNLLRERRIHIAMGREAAMTIAGTGPHDPQAVRGQGARLLQGLQRPVTHGASVVFPLTHTRHHILLARQGAARTLLIEGTASHIPLGIEPELVQEIIG